MSKLLISRVSTRGLFLVFNLLLFCGSAIAESDSQSEVKIKGYAEFLSLNKSYWKASTKIPLEEGAQQKISCTGYSFLDSYDPVSYEVSFVRLDKKKLLLKNFSYSHLNNKFLDFLLFPGVGEQIILNRLSYGQFFGNQISDGGILAGIRFSRKDKDYLIEHLIAPSRAGFVDQSNECRVLKECHWHKGVSDEANFASGYSKCRIISPQN